MAEAHDTSQGSTTPFNGAAADGRGLPLIQVQGLTKLFPISKSLFRGPKGYVHAVDDVSFDMYPGESFGLVGESGCGKATIGKLLVKLLAPTEGRILFRDSPAASSSRQNTSGQETPEYADISQTQGRGLKAFRRRAQMIFQDPYESMNPRRTIFDTIAEPLVVQGIGSSLDRLDKVSELLEQVGLTPPATMLFRYPHELSGGQQQRVAVARAVVGQPTLVLADEPTANLDSHTSDALMDVMERLNREHGTTFLFSTHDPRVMERARRRVSLVDGQIVSDERG